jgi:hypothetical protein
MDWRCGSSSREPALQAQSPQFKPQSHQKERAFNHKAAKCEETGDPSLKYASVRTGLRGIYGMS